MKIAPFIIFFLIIVIGISYFMGLVMIHIINKKINNNKFVENFKNKKRIKKNKKTIKKKKLKIKNNKGINFNLNIPLDNIVISKAKELLKDKYGVDSQKLDDDGNIKKYKNYYQKFVKSKNKDNDEKFEVKGYNIKEYLS